MLTKLFPANFQIRLGKIGSKTFVNIQLDSNYYSFFCLFKQNIFKLNKKKPAKKNNFIMHVVFLFFEIFYHQVVNNNKPYIHGRNLLDYKPTVEWFDGRDRCTRAIRIYLMWANGYGYVLINNVYLKRIDARTNQRLD